MPGLHCLNTRDDHQWCDVQLLLPMLCRRPERTAGSRADVSDNPPAVGSIHHATVVSMKPFGLFVELQGFRRNGLVHNSQISEDVIFSREDDDEAKVQAMEYFAPTGSKVSLAR